MECPNCFYLAAPGEAPVEGACPQCGEQPEYDQPSGTNTDFQAFGMPAPGEDDGNQGNPLATGTIMGKDGEKPFIKRDNFMGSVQPPLWYAASELPEDPDVPMDMVDVIEADDLPKKRKDRDLDSVKDASIEKEAVAFAVPLAGLAGRLAVPAVGGLLRGALGKGVGQAGKKLLTKPTLKGVARGMAGGAAWDAVKGLAGGGGHSFQPQMVAPPSYYSYHQVLAEAFNPAGLDRIPGNESEDADPHQHDDGDQYFGDDGVNDIGGSSTGFDPHGEGMKLFESVLPKVLHFLTSDEPGESDPELQQLHQLLDQEQPGYLDQGNDDEAERLIMLLLDGEPGDDAEVESGHDPMEETPNDEPVEDTERNDSTERDAKVALQQPNLNALAPTTVRPEDLEEQNQAMQGRCAQCGSTVDPSTGGCSQCGQPSMNHLHAEPVLAAEKVEGPLPNSFMYEHTDIPPDMTIGDWNSAGRPVHCDDCQNPTVDDRTRSCLACGAEKRVASGQGPQTDEQKAAVAELLQQSGREDEVPQMLLHPEEYAEELSQITGNEEPPPPDEQSAPPAQEEAPPGATMPVPGMQAPPAGPPQMGMMAAVNKYSDDHVQQHGDNYDNQLAVDAADQVHQEDREQEQDTGHTWVDEQGNPLRVGQEYEMFSANYDIPDMVRIEAVKPDSIEYTLTGEYGMEHTTELDWEEAQLEQLSFTPASTSHPDSINQIGDDLGREENMEDIGRPAPGMDQTDLSTPHQKMTATSREWLKEGGAKFTLMEQREFIEEAGVARNADKLDLSNTHYESSVGGEVDLDHFLFGL